MELFYQKDLDAGVQNVIFPTEESRHLIKVLRKKAGDIITVTNGRGLEWIGEISNPDPRKVTAQKISADHHQPIDPPIHIAIAPTKSNERMEWFLEKATEIGVTEITPLICHHSERKVIKPSRMEKILVGAIKQSAQFHLPQLNSLCNFEEFLQKKLPENRLIAHCGSGEKKELHHIDNLESKVLILIGPEGDFSENEIEMARTNSFKEISLGKRRLRTETAGLVACSGIVTFRSALMKF